MENANESGATSSYWGVEEWRWKAEEEQESQSSAMVQAHDLPTDSPTSALGRTTFAVVNTTVIVGILWLSIAYGWHVLVSIAIAVFGCWYVQGAIRQGLQGRQDAVLMKDLTSSCFLLISPVYQRGRQAYVDVYMVFVSRDT